MTVATWPETLPASPLQDRFQEILADTTLRTAMDQGPAKLRRRTTAGVGSLDMTYLLSVVQVSALEVFYRDTLQGGSQPFAYVHPRSGNTVQLRFKKPPSLIPRNGQYYNARLELEILP